MDFRCQVANYALAPDNPAIDSVLLGTPVTDPKDWFSLSPCKYDVPNDPYVAVLLDQNISGEQCAISTYKAMMDATKDKDMVTYNLAL